MPLNTPRNARKCELFLYNTSNYAAFLSFSLGRAFQTNTTQRLLLISEVPKFRDEHKGLMGMPHKLCKPRRNPSASTFLYRGPD